MILRCMWCELPCGIVEPGFLKLTTRHDDCNHETIIPITSLMGWRVSIKCGIASCDQTVIVKGDDDKLVVNSRHHGKWHQNRLDPNYLLQLSRCLTFNQLAEQMQPGEVTLIEQLVTRLKFSEGVDSALKLLIAGLS